MSKKQDSLGGSQGRSSVLTIASTAIVAVATFGVVAGTGPASAAAVGQVLEAPSNSALAGTAGRDAGLFGSADPTYDGVFRQSLALLALDASRSPVPWQAVAWLKGQQCANGAFQAYRPNVAIPCGPSDPGSYSGPDTNSTALAVAALNSVDQRAVAARGIAWLRTKQNADGGWAYVPGPGATTDANSTGLAMMALEAGGASAWKIRSRLNRSGVHALMGLQANCGAAPARRGGIAYQSGGALDDSATAQGALGLIGLVRRTGVSAGVVPVARPFTLRSAAGTCVGANRAPGPMAVNFLADRLTANGGLLPDAWNPAAVSVGNTAYAALAVAASGSGKAAVDKAVFRLSRQAASYVRPAADDAGRLALLALTARQGGANPVSFGGVNLINRLQQTRRP